MIDLGNKLYFTGVLACVLSFTSVPSAAEKIEDGRVWLTYTADHQLSTAWRVAVQVQPYWRNEGHTNDQVTGRAGLYYQMSDHLTLGGGYAYALGHPDTQHDSHEDRLWEDFIYRFDTTNAIQLSTRIRFEHRHFEHKGSMLHGARQLLRLAVPMTPRVSFLVSEEYYYNLNRTDQGESGFDQNRIFVGLAARLTSASNIEFGYVNQYASRSSADIENHILALSLSQTF